MFSCVSRVCVHDFRVQVAVHQMQIGATGDTLLDKWDKRRAVTEVLAGSSELDKSIKHTRHSDIKQVWRVLFRNDTSSISKAAFK